MFRATCLAPLLALLLTKAAWVRASESWVTGKVVDEHGKPVADAKVYVAATYYGGIRMYETAAMARTDAQGHYNVIGDGDLPNLSGTIVVVKEGMAPAMGWASFGPALPFRIAGQARKWPPAPVRDFAMTSHGGSLDVVATLNGQPAAGIMVNLRLRAASCGIYGLAQPVVLSRRKSRKSLIPPARPTKPASHTSRC